MGVNRLNYTKYFFYVCLVSLGMACRANVEVGSDDILKHVSKNIMKSTSEYGERIEHCDQLVASGETPLMNQKKLKSIDATREVAVVALGYLQFRNYFLCEEDSRLQLAFHLGTMEALKRELGDDIAAVKDMQSVVSYPSRKEIELEIKYQSLTKEQKNYFESTVGKVPFDLMKALQSNNLLRE